jgi:hypothetical protein
MAGTISSEYTKTYTSFSGCDIVATFGAKVIGELQAITYSVQREKAPVYTMGSPEPRSFSRGKRGIAGSLVFTVFDRDALIAGLADHVEKEKTFHRIGGNDLEYRRISVDEWDNAMTDTAMSGVNQSGQTVSDESAEQITKNISTSARPVYADEIPPFDITISFANEYGQKAVVVLYAVEILNESSGFSIDNVTSEKACTFVARKVEYMKPVDRNGQTIEDAKAITMQGTN